MEDLIDQANEIQESLGRSYGVPDEIDESDLQAGESTSYLARHLQFSLLNISLSCQKKKKRSVDDGWTTAYFQNTACYLI